MINSVRAGRIARTAFSDAIVCFALAPPFFGGSSPGQRRMSPSAIAATIVLASDSTKAAALTHAAVAADAGHTVGPSASFAANGSGTGSSPALIREMTSAARRRASSAVITPWRPTVTRFAARPPARVCTT